MRAEKIKDGAVLLAGKPWMQYVWLFMITALAAALRFYKLGAWSFWIDEIYTINHATAHFSTPQLILEHLPPNRNWVSVSVILTAQAINFWGVSELSARLTAAIIGILTVTALYFPVKKMFNVRVALIAALLLAVSPWHLFWSQNARFYTSMLLFYSLALMFFHFGMENNKPGYFIVFYALLYLSLSERLFAIFIFPVIGIYLAGLWALRFERPPGLNRLNIFLIGIPILAGGAIELFSIVVNSESRFFADFSWFFLYRNDDPFRLLGNIGFNIGMPLMVLGLFSGIFLVLQKNRAGFLMAVNAVIPLIILLAVNPFIFTKDRYVFIILFSWITLAAIAIYELFTHFPSLHRYLTIGIFVMLLADAGGDNLLYFRANHGNRAEWKASFNIIQERSHPEDIIVTYWPEFSPFYLPGREFIQYEDIDVPTLLSSGKRYWFVIDAETIWANPEVVSFLENNAHLIDVRYLRTPDDFFLRIYFFDPDQPLVD